MFEDRSKLQMLGFGPPQGCILYGSTENNEFTEPILG